MQRVAEGGRGQNKAGVGAPRNVGNNNNNNNNNSPNRSPARTADTNVDTGSQPQATKTRSTTDSNSTDWKHLNADGRGSNSNVGPGTGIKARDPKTHASTRPRPPSVEADVIFLRGAALAANQVEPPRLATSTAKATGSHWQLQLETPGPAPADQHNQVDARAALSPGRTANLSRNVTQKLPGPGYASEPGRATSEPPPANRDQVVPTRSPQAPTHHRDSYHDAGALGRDPHPSKAGPSLVQVAPGAGAARRASATTVTTSGQPTSVQPRAESVDAVHHRLFQLETNDALALGDTLSARPGPLPGQRQARFRV